MIITIVNKNRTQRLPPNTQLIYVGRPSPLGNPFKVGEDGTREEVIQKFYAWVETTEKGRKELRRIVELARAGQNIGLACWCYPQRCHAEVIRSVVEERLRDGK